MTHLLLQDNGADLSTLALVYCFIVLGLLAIYVVAGWQIFVKAGRPGWEILIPFYNLYICVKIVGKPGWWVILMCIPYVGIVWHIWSLNMLSKSFGKDEGYTAGLFFLGFIFFPLLAFGNAEYLGPYGDPVAFRAYQMEREPIFEFERSDRPA
jgi:hypothetical protein